MVVGSAAVSKEGGGGDAEPRYKPQTLGRRMSDKLNFKIENVKCGRL